VATGGLPGYGRSIAVTNAQAAEMDVPERVDTLRHLRLGDFIAENSEFTFDLEEFLLSYKLREHLATRMQAFAHCTDSASLASPARKAIAAGLAAGEFTRIPGYRSYRDHSRLEELPTISKEDLRSYGERYLHPDFTNEMIWLKPTTGSSGAPIRIWYSAEFYFELLVLALRKVLFRARRNIPGEHRLFCISISDNHNLPDSVFVDPTGATGLSVQIVVDGSKPETLNRVFRMMRRYSPVCVSSKPSLLEVMSEMWKEQEDARSIVHPIEMISSGSALLPDLRARLSNLMTGRVINAYAMTEFGLIASECEYGGLHIDSSSVFVEVLDEHGNEAAPDEPGEFVLSGCCNMAMPLLRYRTGDLGLLSTERCTCGSQTPRIERLDGRKIQCFRLASGALFPPTCFNDMFSAFPELAEFQVTQQDRKHFNVKVEFKEDRDATPEMLGRITRFFVNAIPEDAEVEVVNTHFSRDSKFERYRSNL
jgi:phenylacetate-CoA ligase